MGVSIFARTLRATAAQPKRAARMTRQMQITRDFLREQWPSLNQQVYHSFMEPLNGLIQPRGSDTSSRTKHMKRSLFITGIANMQKVIHGYNYCRTKECVSRKVSLASGRQRLM